MRSRFDLISKTVALLLMIYVVSEIGYRLYLYHDLTRTYERYTRYGCSTTEAPFYLFDPDTGYSYKAGSKLHLRFFDEKTNLVRESNVIINNLGHLSLTDDFIAKPNSEFRIAVLGDSFSATTPSNIAWPSLLQKYLNQDEAIKRLTKKTTFTVINFGLDGTGIVQWPAVYKHKVQEFHPDLVIVNFIGNDIYRRFLYRATVDIGNGDQAVITCSSLPANLDNNDCMNAYLFVLDESKTNFKSEISRFKKEMFDHLIDRLPWVSPYPELLGLALNGRLGLHPQLQLKKGPTPNFEIADEALAVSQSALRTIAAEQAPLIILYHPVVQECLSKQTPREVKELMKNLSALQINNMLEYLPVDSSQEEIKKWYNLPYDQHPSDYGAAVYARAVEGRVVDYLSRRSTTAGGTAASGEN
jgi:lysophospholipase L1-like esterase